GAALLLAQCAVRQARIQRRLQLGGGSGAGLFQAQPHRGPELIVLEHLADGVARLAELTVEGPSELREDRRVRGGRQGVGSLGATGEGGSKLLCLWCGLCVLWRFCLAAW